MPTPLVSDKDLHSSPGVSNPGVLASDKYNLWEEVRTTVRMAKRTGYTRGTKMVEPRQADSWKRVVNGEGNVNSGVQGWGIKHFIFDGIIKQN